MKLLTAYLYNAENFFFEKEISIQKNLRASERKGEEVFILPPNSTLVKPPLVDGIINPLSFFDKNTDEWRCGESHVGEEAWEKDNGTQITIKSPGPLPENLTQVQPDHQLLPFLRFDDILQKWVLDSSKRESLEQTIWKLRKQKREVICQSDILYKKTVDTVEKEFFIHMDTVSYNDVLLAAQNAFFTGDLETTRNWITATGEIVALNGHDFQSILAAYGARREEQVYSSNAAWQEDIQLDDDSLLGLYSTLILG